MPEPPLVDEMLNTRLYDWFAVTGTAPIISTLSILERRRLAELLPTRYPLNRPLCPWLPEYTETLKLTLPVISDNTDSCTRFVVTFGTMTWKSDESGVTQVTAPLPALVITLEYEPARIVSVIAFTILRTNCCMKRRDSHWCPHRTCS